MDKKLVKQIRDVLKDIRDETKKQTKLLKLICKKFDSWQKQDEHYHKKQLEKTGKEVSSTAKKKKKKKR